MGPQIIKAGIETTRLVTSCSDVMISAIELVGAYGTMLCGSVVCHNPTYLGNPAKKSSCESHMGILLQKFVSLGRLSAQSAELVKKQYQKFSIVSDQNPQSFSSFNPTNDRVDELFQK